MNKPTIKLNKKPEQKAKVTPEVKKEARPATKPKKDKAPKTWAEALQKWRGGDKLPAPIHCVVYQLVGMAYSQKRPELLELIPEEWQELAQKRYADPQFKKEKSPPK